MTGSKWHRVSYLKGEREISRTAKVLERTDNWIVILDNPKNGKVVIPWGRVRLIEQLTGEQVERLDALWDHWLTGEPTEAMKRAFEANRPAAEERLRETEAGSFRRDDDLAHCVTFNMLRPYPDLLARYEEYRARPVPVPKYDRSYREALAELRARAELNGRSS